MCTAPAEPLPDVTQHAERSGHDGYHGLDNHEMGEDFCWESFLSEQSSCQRVVEYLGREAARATNVDIAPDPAHDPDPDNLAAQFRVRQFKGTQPYWPVFQAMKSFTEARNDHSPDELWLVEHQSTFTQGQAGKPEHLLNQFPDIPVVATDRGGQITWHGPGQLVLYCLLDLNRLGWNVRQLVSNTETTLIHTLRRFDIEAAARPDAPGVYVRPHTSDCEVPLSLWPKIASLGFKIRRGRSYHGLALNLDCTLAYFDQINPCGYAGLSMARLRDFVTPAPSYEAVAHTLIQEFFCNYPGQGDFFSR